jgi:hypothetical protein
MNPLRQITNSCGIIHFLSVLLDARRQIAFWLAFGFVVVATGSRGEGFLIPDTTRRDMVFDFAGQNLYISTSTGLIKTFQLSTLTFGTTYNPGGSLNGIDIARDDSFLLAAQNDFGISQGTFHRIAIATGTITDIHYPLAFGEGGAWDVAIASNGLALVTTQFQGSGWTPLRKLTWTRTPSLSEQMLPAQAQAVWSGRIPKSIVVQTERASFLWKAIFPVARFSPTAISQILSGKVQKRTPPSMLLAGR